MQGLRPHLVDACIAARERHGQRREAVAGMLNIDIGKVKRFVADPRWSAHTDLLIPAYAKIAGVTPFDLWREAIDRWEAAQGEDRDAGPGPLPEALGDPPEDGKTTRARGRQQAG